MATFQEQYPLSPRKFWKKMIPTIFSGFFLAILLAISVSVLDASLFPVVFLGSFAAIIFIYAWYYQTYIQRYYYDANDNFVTIKKGVFAPTEIHVQFTKIQDVYVDQDILDRVMGLYDVHIASATATSGIEAHIDGVEQAVAEGLKELLLAKIQGASHPSTPPASIAADAGTVGTSQSISDTSPASSTPIQLREDISSTTYPLSGAWVAQQLITYFFSSLSVAIFLTFYVGNVAQQSHSVDANLYAILGLFPLIPFVAIFVIVYIFHIIYMFLWKSSFSFAFLPEYVVMKTGVISRSEVHVPYHTIQDVIVSQGIVERMFGIATAQIQNAASAQPVKKGASSNGISIPGQTLERANHISDIVKGMLGARMSTQTGL
jgi:uncharacterized membrane protein YdbT with pleckstrin-like domain